MTVPCHQYASTISVIPCRRTVGQWIDGTRYREGGVGHSLVGRAIGRARLVSRAIAVPPCPLLLVRRSIVWVVKCLRGRRRPWDSDLVFLADVLPPALPTPVEAEERMVSLASGWEVAFGPRRTPHEPYRSAGNLTKCRSAGPAGSSIVKCPQRSRWRQASDPLSVTRSSSWCVACGLASSAAPPWASARAAESAAPPPTRPAAPARASAVPRSTGHATRRRTPGRPAQGR